MKLKYYLMPMHLAAAWQVVEGEYPTDADGNNNLCGKCVCDTYGNFLYFDSNTERDEWIAAVHKHLAEWAWGKDEVPEAVREADEIMSVYMSLESYKKYLAWRDKWMKPRAPKDCGEYTYEV